MKYTLLIAALFLTSCTTTTTTMPDGTKIRTVTQDTKAIKALENVGQTLGPIVLQAALEAAQNQSKP